MTYRDAGVDIDATSAAVGRIAERARTMLGATGAADIGHFGGMYRLPSGPDRLLVASADGVGTKLKLAFLLGGEAHARMGEDLVNHCVNDILSLGARPLFFLDYFSTGHFDQVAFDGFVAGLVEGCAANGMALIGGETAEMPGMYAPGEYDAAGFIVGEVAPDRVIDGSDVRPGDVLLGLPSGGLQTNGFSLARRIAGLSGAAEDAAADRARLAEPLPGDESVTVGDALIAGHATFRPAVAPLAEHPDHPIRGMVHVTGGGLVDNVPRILGDELAAEIDPSSWPVPPVFTWLTMAGDVPFRERYRAFNMGIGFVVVVRPEDADAVRDEIPGAVAIGRVVGRRDGGEQVLGLG
jgi:phosphoribosylformylglycinamidine cyclo-ligase